MTKYRVLLLTLALVLAGCASDDTKDYDGALHYQMGLRAEQQGDLKNARDYFAQAMKSAHSGRLGPAKEAFASYAWGRVSGYLGFYADAEKGFENAISLVEKSQGDADNLRGPALFELARLFHDTGQHAKAVKAYAKAFAELERRSLEHIEPWAYIGFLEDYAESLDANGEKAAAEGARKRAAEWREKFKGTAPRINIQRYKS